MNRFVFRLSILSVSVTAAVGAHASLLDLEDLQKGGFYGNAYGYPGATSQGYSFRAVALFGWTKPLPTDNGVANYTGSVALFATIPGDEITMFRQDGKAFSLTSMDVANSYTQNPGGASTATVFFTGVLAAGGTVTQSFTTGRTDSLQKVSFSGFQGVTSVSWRQGSYPSYTQFDNVNVQAVPEPATMAALCLAVCAVRRRRNKS